MVRPPILPGWPHRWMVTHPDPEGTGGQNPAYRSAHRHPHRAALGLCSFFRLQGSWRVSAGQLPTQVALLLSGYLARQETDQNFNSTWVK